MNNITYAPDMSEEMRREMEALVRTMNPEADETMVREIAHKMMIQAPLYVALGEKDREIVALKAALAAAQYRNTSLDNKTDKIAKTPKADLADEKKAHAETKEDLERTEKQLRSSQSQIEGLMKAQGR